MGLLGGDLPFARTLTVQDLEAFTALGTARSFAPGEHLFSEGDRTTHVLLILTGWSMVFTAVDRGATRLVLGLRGPDELLGELAALDQRPRSATVQALGAAQALVVPGEGFRRFLAENPRAGSRVMTQLASRLRDSDRERSALASLTVVQRLARRLIELSGTDATSRPGRNGGAAVVQLAQDDLAATVGATREAVAKALRLLRDQGLVRTGTRKVEILAPAPLLLLAQGPPGQPGSGRRPGTAGPP
ncbi:MULTISPECIES: Crp/Fnr family transcriptional regulator [Kitasatospora]|uniref:Putative Crp family transcriptional regulator n=1 Tax=Kitasatospora setae (strain ATCC 33774 / DSM 43861 / JCM 3304 / KCC A-0304 / NBRC 14216 / KM-6054) TaxID=452652 RepID=E4NIJ6_KITSK|nr:MULTISPECIES: Crp/Fnr family transcriptional regulator [Kitasatospora]BAJ32794.1 putative Crp family transcriptional regulator [Kitasatospora setae KM-6054]